MSIILPEAIGANIAPADYWALTVDSRRKAFEEEIIRRKRLADFLLEPSRGAERAEFQRKCAADPSYFARNTIWTRDPERRQGLGYILPLIPPSYMTTKLVAIPGDYTIGGWFDLWHQSLYRNQTIDSRILHEKTRRVKLSIGIAAFNLWGIRFFPGFDSWASSYSDEAVDHGDDWDAIFGKIRFMWDKVHEFFPWMMPKLPPWGTSSINKEGYIEFAPWIEGGKEIAKECWHNKVKGFGPSEVANRGGASTIGFIDEAAWVENLDDVLDSVERNTPNLILASTPSDVEHPFAKRAQGAFGYTITTTHWTHAADQVEGIYWDEAGDYRGPYTQKWRTAAYAKRLETQPSHQVARNDDLDYTATQGSRIFISFKPELSCGSSNSTAANFDLYDPSWRLEIWYDVGRRDPWACIWAQISDLTGEIRIVDFWMRAGVTAEWWIPLWLGWDPDSMPLWKTSPDRLPWKNRVPWRYGPEDIELMRYWCQRFATKASIPGLTRTLRPALFVGDIHGRQRHGDSPFSVEETLQHYGLVVVSASMSHNLEAFVEHADSLMPRVRISGRIADRKPLSGGVRYPSIKDCFLSWRWLEATERERKPAPAHDIYSHACTTFMYGGRRITPRVHGVFDKEKGTIASPRKRGCYTAKVAPARDAGEETTGIPPSALWL